MTSPREPFDIATLVGALDERITSAVETVAATDPHPTDPFRGLYVSDEQARGLARTAGGNLDTRLADARARLGLDTLDTAVLTVCALPELHPRYGRLFGYLHDDLTRRLASPRLVARLVAGDGCSEGDVLARLEADAPLRTLGAIRILDDDTPLPLAERSLKIADQLVSFLLGIRLDQPDPAFARLVPVPANAVPDDDRRRLFEAPTSIPLLVAGADAARTLAAAIGKPLLLVDITMITDPAAIREATLAAALARAQLCFDGIAGVANPDAVSITRAVTSRPGPTLLCASTPAAALLFADTTVLVEELPEPTLAAREAAWRGAIAGDVQDVAAKFRLSIGQIDAAAEVAKLAAHRAGRAVPSPADLDYGARQASNGRLGGLATRLDTAHGWEQLVLPARQREVLLSISFYLRHRDQVLSEWGYDRMVARNQGLKVLFAGESGTGKTMAAQVLAHELGLGIFRLDLATVVSKYIGETEKNLDRVFEAADGSNAIIFFDEADALFGKRSEVRDAHDRYANIEVAYLLQRMETYPGAVILATNFRQNIDDAFLRRLDFVIDFPFPEAADRERIWRLLLPLQAPVDDDIDLSFLAEQFKLAGGNIRNASIAAAFLAAGEGTPIGMGHLVRGVALEYAKLGRLALEADFGPFHDLIRA